VMRGTLITRTGETTYTTSQPWDTNAPRLANFAEPPRFHF
jgi:protein-L-isoaspartate(D-aspartate) O-methyltransferase